MSAGALRVGTKIGTPSWWSPPRSPAKSPVRRPVMRAPVAIDSSNTTWLSLLAGRKSAKRIEPLTG